VGRGHAGQCRRQRTRQPRAWDGRVRGGDERVAPWPRMPLRSTAHDAIRSQRPRGAGRRLVPRPARDLPQRHDPDPRGELRHGLRPGPLGDPAVAERGADLALVRVHGVAVPGAERAGGAHAARARRRRRRVRGAPPRRAGRLPPRPGGRPAVLRRRARRTHVRLLRRHGSQRLRRDRGGDHAARGAARGRGAERGGGTPRAQRRRRAAREPAGADPAAFSLQHPQHARRAGAPRRRRRRGPRHRRPRRPAAGIVRIAGPARDHARRGPGAGRALPGDPAPALPGPAARGLGRGAGDEGRACARAARPAAGRERDRTRARLGARRARACQRASGRRDARAGGVRRRTRLPGRGERPLGRCRPRQHARAPDAPPRRGGDARMLEPRQRWRQCAHPLPWRDGAVAGAAGGGT
jgi:hypothetical protein